MPQLTDCRPGWRGVDRMVGGHTNERTCGHAGPVVRFRFPVRKRSASDGMCITGITADQWENSRKCKCGGKVMNFMLSCSDCFVPDPREVTVVPFPTETEWRADLVRRGV